MKAKFIITIDADKVSLASFEKVLVEIVSNMTAYKDIKSINLKVKEVKAKKK